MQRRSLGVIPFRSARQTRLTLPLSLSPETNIAQISVYPEFESARPFRRERWGELEAFQPNILIGYGVDLQRLADSIEKKTLTLASVNRAIFALTDCGCTTMSEQLRETLWQTFGVPVFELIVAPGYRVLATECEAHDGWHLQSGATPYLIAGELVCDVPPLNNLHTGFTGDIEMTPCPCGRPTPRLKNLAPHLPRPYERRLAAIA